MKQAKIEITVNEDGKIAWEADDRFSGPDVLALMAQTVNDMYFYFFEDHNRPELPTQDSRVCIEKKADAFGVSYRPEADPLAALGMMQAAICGLHQRMSEQNFDPMAGVLGAVDLNRSPITA